MHIKGWDILIKQLLKRKDEKHLSGQELENSMTDCYCQCFAQMNK
jgi:hypothetical protein